MGVLKRLLEGPGADVLAEARRAGFRDGLAKGKEDYDYRHERAEQKAARLDKAFSKRYRA